MRNHVATLCLLLAAASCSPEPVEDCCSTSMEASAAIPDTSVYQIDCNWEDSTDTPRRLADFRGHTTLLAMVFTNCAYACPQLVADLQSIETAMSANELASTRFVLVSMDPARDTPEALAEFAAKHGLAAPRWTLLRGEPANVRSLAAVLGVKFKELPNGDFSHSNLITVLDHEGSVEHRQEGLDAPIEPTLSAIRRLTH